MLDEKVVAFATDAEAIRKSAAVWEILEGPIGESGIGDNDAEMAGAVGFILGGCLQPALFGKANHQARLVILMGGMAQDGGGCDGIAGNFGGQKVAVVEAEAIVGFLPEVGSGVGRNEETRAGGVDAPHRWRVHPLEKRVKRAAVEGIHRSSRWRHRFAPTSS